MVCITQVSVQKSMQMQSRVRFFFINALSVWALGPRRGRAARADLGSRVGHRPICGHRRTPIARAFPFEASLRKFEVDNRNREQRDL